MKIWQFEVDGHVHILKLDTQQSPPTATLDDKPLALTSKLTQKGDAIHRFAFTMMWMMFCWSAFVILASRGIIKIANIPLF